MVTITKHFFFKLSSTDLGVVKGHLNESSQRRNCYIQWSQAHEGPVCPTAGRHQKLPYIQAQAGEQVLGEQSKDSTLYS